METHAMTAVDYVAVIKRRKWNLFLPIVAIFALSVLTALLMPSIYQSSSTILIENQEIPSEYVTSTVTGFAEQRIQSINQRIMSSSKLAEIITRFNLYRDLKDKWTTEEIIEKMREDIRLEPISAEVVDRRTGRPATATIAFSISYEGKNAATVQKVTDNLTSLFLQEDLQVRARQAREASLFLEEELNKVKNKLFELDSEIAVFKEAHINELPEVFPVNVQSLKSAEARLESLNEDLKTLRERESYLQAQMAQTPAEVESLDEKRLQELKSQLIFYRNRYSDEYPDVIKTRAEIEELEKEIQKSKSTAGPDDDHSRNPAYVTMASQLASTRSDIKSIKNQINDLMKQKTMYEQRIAASPGVEKAFNTMMFERRNNQAKYDDLMQKLMESKVAQGLETEQKGEHFTLIEPARFPEKPYKPNRLLIMLIGLILGLGSGVGLAGFMEYSDHSVRSAEQLSRLTDFPVLGTIPEITTEAERALRRTKRRTVVLGILVAIVIGIVIFHFFIMDLNIFWAKLVRNLAI